MFRYRGFTHAPHSSTLSRPTAREMYTFARRFPIVPSFDSFPFNFQVEACQFFSRYTFPFSNDPRKNIALVSGREFQIFVAKLRFFLLCPSRTGRISNRARFFFSTTKNSSPPSLTEISKNLTNSVRSIRKISHFSNIGSY